MHTNIATAVLEQIKVHRQENFMCWSLDFICGFSLQSGLYITLYRPKICIKIGTAAYKLCSGIFCKLFLLIVQISLVNLDNINPLIWFPLRDSFNGCDLHYSGSTWVSDYHKHIHEANCLQPFYMNSEF